MPACESSFRLRYAGHAEREISIPSPVQFIFSISFSSLALPLGIKSLMVNGFATVLP